MGNREILTIQLGHYSNYIGTHWWNIQETNFSYDPAKPSEINPDVLYREGETSKRRVTFTPRVLVVDLKGSLGHLSERGDLYETPIETEEAETLWETTEITKEPKSSKPHFLKSLDEPKKNEPTEAIDIERDVEKWADFLLPRFHPRSLKLVEEFKHECSLTPFDVFHSGQNIWKSREFHEDFTDRIRQYVEECDSIQGFHVLVDSNDGFAGLGASCVRHLRDEYGKSILAFPVLDSTLSEPSSSDLVKAVNIAMCWERLGEHASLFSPLCCAESGWSQAGSSRKFEHLVYDRNSRYQSSAILASALDTLTLRYRHRKYPMSAMSDLCADLNKLGRKAAATSLTLPFPMTAKRDLIDVLDDFEGSLWKSVTPGCEVSTDKNMQSLVLRGIPEERLKRPLQEAKKQVAKAAYRCSSVHEMMSFYLACSCHASATYVSTVQEGMNIRDPYPKIFKDNVHGNGDIAAWPVGEDVTSVPVMAGLHSSSSMGTMFESLHEQVSRVKNVKRLTAFASSGLEQDEFMETANRLLDYKEAYEDQYL